MLDFLQRVVGVAPGAGLGLVHEGTVTTQAYGHLTYQSESQQVTDDTVYDIASVTKVVTSSIVSHLVKRGELHLQTRVKELIPDVGSPVAGLTIQDLLSLN